MNDIRIFGIGQSGWSGESPDMQRQLKRRGAAFGCGTLMFVLAAIRALGHLASQHAVPPTYTPEIHLPKALTADRRVVFQVTGLQDVQSGDRWTLDCVDAGDHRSIGHTEGTLTEGTQEIALEIALKGHRGAADLTFRHEPNKGACTAGISTAE